MQVAVTCKFQWGIHKNFTQVNKKAAQSYLWMQNSTLGDENFDKISKSQSHGANAEIWGFFNEISRYFLVQNWKPQNWLRPIKLPWILGRSFHETSAV